ncbi:MAG: hypothetical protein PHZ02_01650, partial [Desulfocapsaceae bacterium]|nr:hypothetical protein [Desulfocapsaceae bacterium]
GQPYELVILVNQGSITEGYKIVFSGGYTGDSTPFMVTAGTGQQQFTIGNMVFTSGGTKSITASLVKV